MKRALQWEIVRALSVGGMSPESTERLREFGARDWMDCLPWLRLSSLELLLVERMKTSNCAHVIPSGLSPVLDEDAALNRQRLAAMKQEFESLLGLMKASGAPYAVLKGFSLVPDYCPAPQFRNQYDFDFLISAAGLPRVDALLRNAGFIRKYPESPVRPVVYHHAQRIPHPPSTLAGIFSPDLHRSLEVHTQLWESGTEGLGVNWPGDPLSRLIQKDWEGLIFPVLAAEDALLFQVLHTFRHILNNWCRLSWFHEIAVLLQRRSGDETFWMDFRRLVQGQERLCQCVGIVFQLASRLFDAEVPHAIRPFTSGTITPAMALWVERYGIRSAMQNFSNDKCSLLLHELFVEDTAAWSRIRSHRLFPRHKPHTVVSLEGSHGPRLWPARFKQALHALRRMRFHLIAGLKYMGALPLWAIETRPSPRSSRIEIPRPASWGTQASLVRERVVHTRKADV